MGALEQGVGVAGSAAVGITPLLTTAAWAVPVVGTAVAAVTLAVMLLKNRRGPQQRIQTSQWADDAERVLQDNLGAFERQANSATKTVALENFDSVWAELVSRCGDPAMGNPGRACIADRQRGGKFDWWAAYRDPIERTQLDNDGYGFTGGGVSLPWWVLPVVCVGGALVLLGGEN